MNKKAVFGWCLYDFAISAFNTLVGTFIFAVYFTNAVAPDVATGTFYWGLGLAASSLVVAIASPILGAVADARGQLKKPLFICTILCGLATLGLAGIAPAPEFMFLALCLILLANITFELTNVYYGALLPVVAPAAAVGRISGWGWGAGYAGGLLCLILALLLLVKPIVPWFDFLDKTQAEPVRATNILAGLWLLVFSLPLFLLCPDVTKISTAQMPSFKTVWQGLWHSLRKILSTRRMGGFLLGTAILRDGLNTLFQFGGVYAAAVYGFSQSEILLFAIALNISAGLGAAIFAFADDRFGAASVLYISILGLLCFGVPLLMAESQFWFWILAVGLGVFVGPAQAAARSWLAREAAPEQRAEIFGLYALSGRAVSFIGPLAYGTAVALFGTQQAGMAVVVCLWAVALLVLRFALATKN